MIAFIDDHRKAYVVEPICRVLPIAPSTYFERVAQRQHPMRLSAREQRDQVLKPEVARVFAENFAVYGVRKIWRQIRAGFSGGGGAGRAAQIGRNACGFRGAWLQRPCREHQPVQVFGS